MIAVTGALGFIGTNLARRLDSEGHELLLVDHPITALKAGNRTDLDHHPFIDHETFATQLEDGHLQPDAIFHLGACSATTEVNWSYLTLNNVEYSKRLWAWCAARGKPYLYASSAATYGDGQRGFDDRTPPADLTPLNLYGKSKNDFDIWVLAEIASAKLAPPRWVGLKFFNVYGPHESHKDRMASVVWQTYRQVRETGEVRLFRSSDPTIRDGEQKRDFVFVGDCVDHLLWLWRHSTTSGLFNSGTGIARTFYDLALGVFAALDREPRIRFIDMPTDLTGRYQNFTQAEMSKLRDCGYPSPPTTLESSVRETVRWLEANTPRRVAA